MDDQQDPGVSTSVSPQDCDAPTEQSIVATKRRHSSGSPPQGASQRLRRRLETSEAGSTYTNIVHSGGTAQYGNTYHSGPSPDERTLQAILESLRYDGMHARRDTLDAPSKGTFDWKFLKGAVDLVVREHVYESIERDNLSETRETIIDPVTQTFDISFRSWLEQDAGGLFCFTGKPGAGKSTLMYGYPTHSSAMKH